MELREFAPEDAAQATAYAEVENSVVAVDAPWRHPLTAYRVAMQMRYGWDNKDLAWIGVSVVPEHRRQGLGSAILETVLEEVARTGRHLVGIDGWDGPGARAFAAVHGFEERSRGINRRLNWAEVDLDEVRDLRHGAAVAASAYDLVRVTGHTPDDLLEAVAELTGTINDAPMDDLEYEDEEYPPERIRAYEDVAERSGHRFYRLLARHRDSGELAGHTVVLVETDRPAYAHQHDTSVTARHRGHRLGLLLKAEMVLWLSEVEPQLDLSTSRPPCDVRGLRRRRYGLTGPR